jgi:predicted amidohydrolase
MQDLTIHLVQSNLVWEDKQANLDHFSRVLSSSSGYADVILLPEMFSTGFSVHPAALAEGMEGPTIAWLREKAGEKGAALIASFIYGEGEAYYNRLVFMMPGGSFRFYDKRHLFRLAGEHHRFSAGHEGLVLEYKGWRIRPLICYDLRFPVWSRNRYRQGSYDYDLLIYVANWPRVRSFAWKSLLVARAIENLTYLAAVNRVGFDGNDMEHTGDSVVLDPAGNILTSALPGSETVLKATLSAAKLKEFREKFAFGQDADDFTLLH